MPFIHNLFVGHFDRDGEVTRFAKAAGDSACRPVVCRSIDQGVLQAALRDVLAREPDGLAFPDDWTMWLDDGYLVCNKYTRNRQAIDVIARVVERTRCDIYDVAAHTNITLRDWLSATEAYAAP